MSLALSKVALGCGVFSGAYGDASQDKIELAVRQALKSGITLFDTSPYYNDSEIKLGKALQSLRAEYPRSSYHICTKLGRYGYYKKDFDYSAKRVTESVQESMRRLHTDYLDIVLCHDVEFVDKEQVLGETLPRLFELKKKGIVRRVGISGYPLDVLLEIAQAQSAKGEPLDVCLSYCNFNLHCQRLTNYAAKLKAAGVQTIISASPLSMGLLRQNETPAWHPAKPELKQAVVRCTEHVEKSTAELSLAEIAEHFSFSCTNVDVHLIGAKTKEEVEHALDAYERSQKLRLASGGKYQNEEHQLLFEKIMEELLPFADYTWESPPADA
ncbi:hypothetical protein GGI07_005604 [Coemansia sp. Benny D115]|nr:hypothetical protein GGI07_005604 [Coemansia sp. Benny D115]